MMLPVVVHSAAPERYWWNGAANDVVLSYMIYHVNPERQRGRL